MSTAEERIREHLEFLYGSAKALQLQLQLSERLENFRSTHPERAQSTPLSVRLSERDAILITYGDQIRDPGRPPLQVLADFLASELEGVLSAVHILPFYPYSSDDGFSVIDYTQVDPAIGDWEDIRRLGSKFRLMFDAVVNHISRHSRWFQEFLDEKSPYRDYFIVVDPEVDLSMVVRPRALPLLTPVETTRGETLHVWTTFSDDQIDLNFANPRVLLEFVDILLFYVSQGAEFIRLDAIAYLWKEIGSPSIHLPETHHVVKLFRAVLDVVAPGTILITETNVPHEENISYFGSPLASGTHTDEAQMVYQFPLAPLVLHTFRTGDARVLSRWAAGLHAPSPGTTFFNFIASHDGIGLRPVEGLLNPQEVHALVQQTLDHGGQASFRTNQDGTRSVYELNITLFDFLNNPADPHIELDVRRFLASQAIMLSLAGVPGIYVHSLFGSRNCHSCLKETGRARSINREKFAHSELKAAIADSGSVQHRVFHAYRHLLRQRREQPAFHPSANQKVLQLGASTFALVRSPAGGGEPLLSLVDVSGEPGEVELDLIHWDLAPAGEWLDLLDGSHLQARGNRLTLPMQAYQVRWLVRA